MSKAAKKAAPKKAAGLDPVLATALTRGLKCKDKVAAGMHRVRGRAVIDVDCFVQKGGPQQQKIPWPAGVILALALSKAVPDRVRMTDLLCEAANRALASAAPAAIDLGLAGEVLEGVRNLYEDKVPTVPKEGNTSVTGQVELVRFEPAE